MSSLFNRKDLIYTVYKEKSFSAAAQKLFVSQPSLSVMVKRVEDEVGVPLFDRTTKPIRLTKAGKEYIKASEQIFAIEKSFTNYLSSVNNLQGGTLDIGSSQLLSSVALPKYIFEFSREYPNIHLSVVDADSRTLANYAMNGSIDMIIDNQEMDRDIFTSIPLWNENLVLCVPSQFPINEEYREYQVSRQEIADGKLTSDEVTPVPLSGFRETPFVLITKENDIRNHTEEIFEEESFKPEVLLELDRLETLYNYVELGMGASVISDTLILGTNHDYSKVCFYRLAPAAARRVITASYKKNSYFSPAMNAFLRVITGKEHPVADTGDAAAESEED
ncbi:LysR family transcriptional regulator [Clostridium vitabionis]|uniref:LysR family transcriptional regulator n=1 Tax=Clostridium vitabionis TaxID=2784388 RepID=UPI00188D9C72|nr:LysR family transcriptional regulator [Clostridium vitabionis]